MMVEKSGSQSVGDCPQSVGSGSDSNSVHAVPGGDTSSVAMAPSSVGSVSRLSSAASTVDMDVFIRSLETFCAERDDRAVTGMSQCNLAMLPAMFCSGK